MIEVPRIIEDAIDSLILYATTQQPAIDLEDGLRIEADIVTTRDGRSLGDWTIIVMRRTGETSKLSETGE